MSDQNQTQFDDIELKIGANPTPVEPTDNNLQVDPYLTQMPKADASTGDERPGDSMSLQPASDPKANSDIFPGYEVLRTLGEGGMGIVYLARHVALNREVALKTIRNDRNLKEINLPRFLAEAKSLASIQHPHVVQVYDSDETDGRPYMTMEYLSRGSLADRLRPQNAAEPMVEPRRLRPQYAAELMAKIARGVHAMHSGQIIHRDLKPANILFDFNDEPKVTDFGLAKSPNVDLTWSGQFLGTPLYSSPEQAEGRSKFVGPRADVHALGVILYECLTGSRPFEHNDIHVLITRIVMDDPELPSRRVPGLPRDLEQITLKCLAKAPDDRYETADELAEDLRRFTDGEPVSVRKPGLAERALRWARRKPTLAKLYFFGVLASLLVIVLGWAVWQWRITEWEREKVTRYEYGRTIEVAHQDWIDNNIDGARTLLDGTRVDLRGWEWGYVHRLCHSDQLTLAAHTKPVYSVTFSADGSRILTASQDGTTRVWDARNGAELLRLNGLNKGRPWMLELSPSFSADGSRILTGGDDPTVVWVWDAGSGAQILTLKGHNGHVYSASFSVDGSRILTASQDGTARVWDTRSGNEVLKLEGHTGVVFSASFSLDGSRILTGGDDGTARVWDAHNGNEFFTLEGHTGNVGIASFSSDGSRILTIGSGTAWVWDAIGDEAAFSLGEKITVGSFSADGTRILTASLDGTARVWDARSGAELLTLKGHTESIWSATFSADGSRILTGGDDGTARVWDARSGAELLTLKGHTAAVRSVSFGTNGSRVLTGSYDGTARVWDARRDTGVITLAADTEGYVTAWSSANGSRALTITHDGTAQVWDFLVGKSFTLNVIFDFNNDFASFSSDGFRILIASNKDRTLSVWDARNGAELLTLRGNTGNLRSASFSPDGSRILTSGDDQTARVWDARSGAQLLTLTGRTKVIRLASFSADGTRILTASLDGTARVWDARSGAELLTLKGHTESIWSATFSADSSRILTGGDDGTARVWDARSGAELLTLKGRIRDSRSISFSEDGSRILTGNYDGTARVWDAHSGAQLLTLTGHTKAVNSVSFNSDGSRILTGGDDGTVRVWDARSGAELLKLKGPYGVIGSVLFSKDGSRIIAITAFETRVWCALPLNREFLMQKIATSARSSEYPRVDH